MDTVHPKKELNMGNTNYPQPVKQDKLLNSYADIIEKKGKLFQKTKGVFATVAEGGELIISKTSDGEETKNTAVKGDYIVTNDSGSREKYIITAVKFNDRYVHLKDKYYVPNDKARVFALQITADNIHENDLAEFKKIIIQPGHPVYIEAPWKESQVLRLNDYLVCPITKKEVYRIAQLEFKETYQAVQ